MGTSRKSQRSSSVILQYTEIPNGQREIIVRLLEDARYRSYDSPTDSSHNGIISGRFKFVSLWDDGTYVGYHKQNHHELSQGQFMEYDNFVAMLKYKAGE